jgi:hypothetical protein
MAKLNISRKEWIQFIIGSIFAIFFIVFCYFKALPLDNVGRIRVGILWSLGTVSFFLFTQLDKGYFFYSRQMESYKSNHSQDYFWISSLGATIGAAVIAVMFFIMAFLK